MEPRTTEAGVWPVCPASPRLKCSTCLNRMKILKKTFAIGKAFDYISAPRQTEQFAETR
jgi:hypothetical protein